jgi:hypothetical protein
MACASAILLWPFVRAAFNTAAGFWSQGNLWHLTKIVLEAPTAAALTDARSHRGLASDTTLRPAKRAARGAEHQG